MTVATVAAIAYGILALVGGIMGYVKVKSKISLISGSSSGVLLLACAVLMLQGYTWSAIAAGGITAILIITFIMRWVKTRKVMPAGLMVILGIPALILMLLPLINAPTS